MSKLTALYRAVMYVPPYDERLSIIGMLESSNVAEQYLGIKAMLNEGIIQEGDRVTIEYSGSGDSGDISRVVWEGPTFDTMSEEWKKSFPGDSDRYWESVQDHRITQCVWSSLESIDYDWYNNDGGSGTVEVDLYRMTYSIEGVAYYTAGETAQSESGALFPEADGELVHNFEKVEDDSN